MSLAFDEEISRDSGSRDSFDRRIYDLRAHHDFEAVTERAVERAVRASASGSAEARAEMSFEAVGQATKQYSLKFVDSGPESIFSPKALFREEVPMMLHDGSNYRIGLSISDTHIDQPVESIGPAHSRMWFFLVLLALVIGLVAGASFFGQIGVSASVALYCLFATVGLSVTLYMLSSRSS